MDNAYEKEMAAAARNKVLEEVAVAFETAYHRWHSAREAAKLVRALKT